LHFFQQEEYEGLRFLKGIFTSKRLDKKLSVLMLLIGCVSFWVWPNQINCYVILFSALALIFAFLQPNPLKKGKKPLVFTKRATRIFLTANGLAFCLLLFAVGTNYLYFSPLTLALSLIIWIQGLPVILVVGNELLWPLIEMNVQRRILNAAKARLAELNPTIIGITGSYGKTSTKHFLAHILSAAYPTLATPGSVNTLMGVSRIIREQLTAEHQMFVVEMGAYAEGAIRKKCQLTPPKYGILTSIGHAHYERFKTIQTVAKTKSELLEAVLGCGGDMVINKVGLDLTLLDQSLLNKHPNQIIYVTHDATTALNQFQVKDVQQTADGLIFTLVESGKAYQIQAPIYGKHHVHNIACAFAMARRLKMSAETIMAAIRTLPQVNHRMEVSKLPNGVTIVDDAYNSNPIGFRAALELLSVLRTKSGQRILVTPGMTELGKQHDSQHFEIGKLAGQLADLVLVVLPHRLESFIRGFKESASASSNLMTFDDFKSAKSFLDKQLKCGDVVLYENDLPDLYESRVRF
jgi:UDP-N-acetylmuramoyl-tripeptide--D-alanyl-D-alanine ligase